jgi:hypothetical protein
MKIYANLKEETKTHKKKKKKKEGKQDMARDHATSSSEAERRE